MNTKDSLGDRMKENYEAVYSNIRLPKRMPVILRIDGKAFHTLTRECKKPFDESLISLMNDTATYLCENIQGSQIAYVQSDEISILLHNYKKFTSQAWFDNELQKMVSISSGLASSFFTMNSGRVFPPHGRLATFDSRAFVLPETEVNNYFLWRQQDATRNSVQMLARSLFSHKQCDHKNLIQLQEMIIEKGQDWKKISTAFQRGRCIVKKIFVKDGADRSAWTVDNEIPSFAENRNYINELLAVEEK
jgi:tRNA(His) guanylyltransferase